MPSDPVRVLVIDDEAVLRGLLQDMLAACGYRADVAESGAAGLARYQAERYRAVITDLLMPEMNGFEVVTALRTIDPAVRVIMLTGSAPAQTAAPALTVVVPVLVTFVARSPTRIVLLVPSIRSLIRVRLSNPNAPGLRGEPMSQAHTPCAAM